jgi:hypothetical protein
MAAAGLLAVTVVLAGCVVQQSAQVNAGVALGSLKTFYVVRLPDDNGGTNKLIVRRLIQMGFQASSGEPGAQPPHVDALVTYQDKWMWDITMYMIQLDVQIREPRSEIALATGHSLHTSLVRKSPEEMVAEVLGNVFRK